MKTAVQNIAPGKVIDYHGEPCLVLEHRKDGTLLLHLEQMTHAFGSTNNFAASSLRAHLNGPYLRSLTDGNPDEVITRTVDLTALTVEAEDTNPLEQYTVRELAEELFRRIGN